ncbi:MAG: hypothetical protein JO043_05105 [Candidatus Eremiobacteraeota bacterium]|nr:hypothetical protein [Candidatus Eremiobacteraeota bacterium]
MLQIIRRISSCIAIGLALSLVPSVTNAGVVIAPHGLSAMQPDVHYGLVRFRPKAMLLKVHILKQTVANYEVLQNGNTKNHFSAIIGCGIKLINRPHVDQDREEGVIFFPRMNLSLGTDFLCTVTALGEGGVTGTMPVYVTVVL